MQYYDRFTHPIELAQGRFYLTEFNAKPRTLT